LFISQDAELLELFSTATTQAATIALHRELALTTPTVGAIAADQIVGRIKAVNDGKTEHKAALKAREILERFRLEDEETRR
jgi:hypothetical protein